MTSENFIRRFLLTVTHVGLTVVAFSGLYSYVALRGFLNSPQVLQHFQARVIAEIVKQPEFQSAMAVEARRRLYSQIKQDAEQELVEIAGTAEYDEHQAVAGLRAYLSERNPSLAAAAERIVQLPRWREVVAIIGH